MKVYGQAEFMQLELSTPGDISGTQLGRVYADITTPTALIPKFYDGTAYRDLLVRGLGYLTNADISASAAIATSKISLTAPTYQKFTSTGATVGYLFTVTSANATAGATYTNNGNTYTVLGTISGGTKLFCSQASAPQSSGTLAKASGTGDASITFSSAVALATYTRPTPSPLYLKIKMSGGGSGGRGSGTASFGSTTNGGDTAFGANMLIAGGGGAVTGGSASISGSGVSGFGVAGQPGSSSGTLSNAATGTGAALAGGEPGQSPYGGGGRVSFAAGENAAANSGSGGGGAGISNINSGTAGYGGSAGGYIEAIITNPSTTYVYCVGTGGAHGTAGTSGSDGGDGAAGVIEVEEHYQ